MSWILARGYGLLYLEFYSHNGKHILVFFSGNPVDLSGSKN